MNATLISQLSLADGTAPFHDLSPIFVVGAPRSGTTMLQLLLNAHPDIAMNGELHYFDQVLQLRKSVPDLSNRERLDAFFSRLRHVDAFRYLPDLEDQLQGVRRRIEQIQQPSYEWFFRLMLEAPARARGTKRFGEKTPENIRYLRELRGTFPAARIVHIVRDPRDVVSSLLRMPWAPNSVLMNALKWKIDMLFLRDFETHGGQVHQVRYEDLLTAPEATLRALCEAIDVDFAPEMLDFHITADRQIKNEPWKEGTGRALNFGAVGRWRHDLSPGRRAVVQIITAPFLAHYGYAPEPVSPSRLVSLPWILGADLCRYLQGRSSEATRRSIREPDTIFGETERIRSKAIEALLTRKI